MSYISKLSRLIPLFLLLAGLGFVFLNQKSLPNITPLARQFLSKPFDASLNQAAALNLTKLQSQLQDQFIQRVKAISTESDWQQFQKQLNSLSQQKQAFQQKINYWRDLDAKYPNFPTIKLILTSLYYQQQNPQKAKYYLDQAKQLDPNNPNLRQLEKMIFNK
ncbi:MAG: hypothetical protein GXP43_02195 [bacterium]|nr:hypothetical protein [bacterium]